VTARKTNKSAETDETTVGKDESKDVQTTKQAEEAQENLPTSAEKRDADDSNTEGAAKGEVAGGVVRGDVGLDEDADLEVDSEDLDAEDGIVGTVVEADYEGNQYEVPYTLLTPGLTKPRTSDSDDPAKAWTAQEYAEKRTDGEDNDVDPVALVPVEGTPGQTFRVRELPNREVAEKAGIDYDQWVAGLPVRADVPNEAPRRGTPA
jgi:hypothetical protein